MYVPSLSVTLIQYPLSQTIDPFSILTSLSGNFVIFSNLIFESFASGREYVIPSAENTSVPKSDPCGIISDFHAIDLCDSWSFRDCVYDVRLNEILGSINGTPEN